MQFYVGFFFVHLGQEMAGIIIKQYFFKNNF